MKKQFGRIAGLLARVSQQWKYSVLAPTFLIIVVANAAAAQTEGKLNTDPAAADGLVAVDVVQQDAPKSAPATVSETAIQLGPRPYFLVDDMDDGPLQRRLASCSDLPMQKTQLSIGHRGAALQFPEHTRESYIAAARMGAGVIECDVTFTADRELVCRHSQCDLHTTTNILSVPELADKCSIPFKPARFDKQGNRKSAASARCCTSDITLSEFKSLKGKMDAANSNAVSITEYLNGTAKFRTDLYATTGTLVSHAESIQLFKELGVKMVPELKEASVPMPYADTYSQEKYAQHLIDEYKSAGIVPEHVWLQSFSLDDIRYWIEAEPAYGQQAVYLDGRYRDKSFDAGNPGTWVPSMDELSSAGVRFLAPPLWMLLTLDANSEIVPSEYAKAARLAGLELFAWTLEQSGPLREGGGWYYQSVTDAIDNDGDMLTVLDVLVQDVGVIGVFSDWPATVSYYANCMGVE